MMARKDTWMPLDVGDYLRDTTHLTTVEHGAYLLLLMHAWVHGGSLTKDDRGLRSITKMSVRAWSASKDTLMAFFFERDGAYRQKRLDAELAKTSHIVEQRSIAGKAAAEARKRQREANENPTHVEHPLNGCSIPVAVPLQQTGIPLHLVPRTEEREAAASFVPIASAQTPATKENGFNGYEEGKEVVGGWFWGEVWDRIVEAAQIDPVRWLGNEMPARRWLMDGIEPDTIIAQIKRQVGRADHPIGSLNFFEKGVRERHARTGNHR